MVGWDSFNEAIPKIILNLLRLGCNNASDGILGGRSMELETTMDKKFEGIGVRVKSAIDDHARESQFEGGRKWLMDVKKHWRRQIICQKYVFSIAKLTLKWTTKFIWYLMESQGPFQSTSFCLEGVVQSYSDDGPARKKKRNMWYKFH